MNNLEKIVPVAVAGLVLAGAGSIDARAEGVDAYTEPEVETPKEGVEEKYQESALPPTEIKNVISTGQTPTEDGGTETDGVVNLGVDIDGDTATKEGDIFIETGAPTTETGAGVDENGSPVNIEQITQDSQITGSVNPGDTEQELTPDEKDELQQEIQDEAGKIQNGGSSEGEDSEESGGWKLNDVKEGDSLGNFSAVGDATSETVEHKDDNGKVTSTVTTVTVKFEKEVSETESSKLTRSELEAILNTTLTENEDGTYTTADGSILTVTKDDSETTTKTTYQVSLIQTTTVTNGSADIGDNDLILSEKPDRPDGEDSEKDLPTAKEVLEGVTIDGELSTEDGTYTGTYNGETATITKDAEGRIVKVEAGSMTYAFEYKEVTALEGVRVEDLGAETLLKLLGEGYRETEAGCIVDSEGRVLDFAEIQYILTSYEINLSITDSKSGVQDPTYTDNGDGKLFDDKQHAEDSLKGVGLEALDKALSKVKEDLKLPDNTLWTKDSEGVYSAAYTEDGVQKVLTINLLISEMGEVIVRVPEKDLPDGIQSQETVSNTGSAVVTGGSIVWDGLEEIEKDSIFILDADQNVAPNIAYFTNQGGKLVDGSTVFDEYGRLIEFIVVFEGGNSYSKQTYNLSYKTLSSDEAKEFLNIYGDRVSVSGLTQVDWTMTGAKDTTEDKTVTEIVEDESKIGQVITSGDSMKNVEKTDNGYVFYENESNSKVTLTKEENPSGKNATYTGKSEATGRVYTIVEEDTPLSDVNEIWGLLQSQFTDVPKGYTLDPKDIEVNGQEKTGIAYYQRADGSKLVVKFYLPTQTSLTMTMTGSKDFYHDGTVDGQIPILSAKQKSLTLGTIISYTIKNTTECTTEHLSGSGSATGGKWTATESLSSFLYKTTTVKRSYTETVRYNVKEEAGISSVGTKYAGSLNYSRTEVGGLQAEAGDTKIVSQDRVINAGLSTVTTTTSPIVTPPSSGGGSSHRGGGTVRVPNNDAPQVEIPDDDVPLVDVPDDDVPLVEAPVVEIPDDDVPLTDAADTEVPVEEEMPNTGAALAEVPQTGDSFLLETVGLVSACASGLWFVTNKKRES